VDCLRQRHFRGHAAPRSGRVERRGARTQAELAREIESGLQTSRSSTDEVCSPHRLFLWERQSSIRCHSEACILGHSGPC
jgi:hypothetical protein